MSLLSILHYPDPRLNKVAKPVAVFDARLKQLVADMAETMYDAPGIGLAAPQVDVLEQVVVIDVSEMRNDLRVLINPEIISVGTEKRVCQEGCLSVPGVYDDVERPTQVKVRALDVDGNAFELFATDWLAVCVQHEIDHLNGFVFVDYLSPLKRNRIKTRMLKEEREMQRINKKEGGKSRRRR